MYEEGDSFYQDSFVGISDFCGQEHICLKNEAVWSMAYYGYLVRPDIFSNKQTIEVLRVALQALYSEKRFLGDFLFRTGTCTYVDSNFGDYKRFHGTEKILLDGTLVYELKYFGGLVQK
jgi:hypothetical protein